MAYGRRRHLLVKDSTLEDVGFAVAVTEVDKRHR